MSQSNEPGIPGVGAMTDTLEFVKNMWGGMKIPGMVMPTLSIEDINKQIADLKAVEAWLTLNMTMLRGTIQALEVQSATISTLQSMSATMSAMGKTGAEAVSGAAAPFSFSMPTTDKPDAASTGSQAEPAGQEAAIPFANPAIWWNMLQDQFKQAVNSAVMPASPNAEPAEGSTKAAAQPEAPRKGKPAKP